jgi:hypothetical protein
MTKRDSLNVTLSDLHSAYLWHVFLCVRVKFESYNRDLISHIGEFLNVRRNSSQTMDKLLSNVNGANPSRAYFLKDY